LKYWILGMLLTTSLAQMIGTMVAKKALFGGDSIKHRAAASAFMFWQTWLTILAGMSSALMRFAYAIVGIIIGLPALTFPVTPPAMNAIMLMDAPHKTYLAAIVSYHVHNHPVMHAAMAALNDALQRRKDARAEGKHNDTIQKEVQARNKRWIILLLIKHPWLIHHRKGALRLKLEKTMLDQEMKRTKVTVGPRKGKPCIEVQQLKDAILAEKLAQQEAVFNENALTKLLMDIQDLPDGADKEEAIRKSQKALTELKNRVCL